MVDRSFYSTQVLCGALGIDFPEFILDYLLKPDLAIQIKVNEEIRLRRMGLMENQLSDIDKRTIDANLIHKADEIYTSLGLYPFNNNDSLEEGTKRLYRIIEQI